MFCFNDSPFICRETCQGQAFATTSIPPTILFLFLKIVTGGIADFPQMLSETHKHAIITAFVLYLKKFLHFFQSLLPCYHFLAQQRFNFNTFTEFLSKIVITGANSIAGFIDVNTASSILTYNVRTGWINF